MLDSFDERYSWNKPVPGRGKGLKWCPFYNRYHAEGQNCLRCDFERGGSKEKGEA